MRVADNAFAFDHAFAFDNAVALTVHSHLTMHWLDNDVDYASIPYFDLGLKVAHAFATNLTMDFSLVILSALEFHIAGSVHLQHTLMAMFHSHFKTSF